MLIKFNADECSLLNMMLREPHLMSRFAGVAVRGYQAPDPATALQVIRLGKLLETKMERVGEGDRVSHVPRSFQAAFRQHAIERIKTIMDHFKSSCAAMPLLEPYTTLRAKLHGGAEPDFSFGDLIESDDGPAALGEAPPAKE